MWDIIQDTLLDGLKMLPFLLGAYLLIEYLEHKSSRRFQKVLASSGKLGPVWGALLGCVPQCGFSVAAANLYAGGVIGAGTLAAVFVSTSDEAVPILLAHPDQWRTLLLLLGLKVLLGMAAGFLLFLFGGRFIEGTALPRHFEKGHHHCEHCDCEGGIWKNALKHTAGTFGFILAVVFLMNWGIAALGEERLSALLMTDSLFQPFVAALIGLIPNCASSVVLTELLLSGSLSFGAAVGGLCANAGMGLVVLFRNNHKMQDNFKFLGYLYLFGALAGLVLQLIGL